MSKITIDKLYTNYEILNDAKDKISEHAKLYEEIIEGVKGPEKVKNLASQFIARFFKHFPSLQYQAIEAVFDMCEDDSMIIRKHAMKILPSLCKDSKEHSSKVADILSQLLQLEDSQELIIASSSLIEVIKNDPVQGLKGFFKQIQTGEYVVREKCIKFLTTKIQSMGPEVLTKEIEDLIISEVKKVIADSTTEEFNILIQYLSTTRLGSSFSGQLEIIDLCAERAELGQELDLLDKDNYNIDRAIICIDFVLPFFSGKIESTKFVVYMCEQVLSQWEIIGSLDRGEALQLTLARQFASLSTNCGQLEKPIQSVKQIFEVLKMYLPLPPENSEVTVVPFQEFTLVECFIYAFHRLARQCPEFLTEDPAVLKDFRSRLQYFSRGVQGCIKSLNEAGDIKKCDNTEKVNAYKITTNINTLIKDLFYAPPNYKSNITLSWTTPETPKKVVETKSAAGKRHAPITIDFDKNAIPNKTPRKSNDNLKIYTPPGGKFSNNFQNQNAGRKIIRGRGRGRGGGGGRGRGRPWRN